MAAPSPTLETSLTAVKTAISAIGSIGTVVEYDHPMEDPWEYLEAYQNSSTGKLDVWLIDVESIDEVEGPANRENYSIYNIRIRYFSVRVASADWSKQGRILIESVRDALNFASAIFAIGGQRQLRTPETCSLRSWGFEDEGGQRIYKGELALSIEARRFS